MELTALRQLSPRGEDLLRYLFAHQTASIVNTILGVAAGKKAKFRSTEEFLLKFEVADEESEEGNANALAVFDAWADKHNARVVSGG